jgi:diguanylate cyclase (GGDEF)-like protein
MHSPPADITGFRTAAALILQDLRERVGLEHWSISRRDGDALVVLSALDGETGLTTGDVRTWKDSFCAVVLDGHAPMCTEDTAREPALLAMAERISLKIGSCAVVPVTAPGGEVLATICGLGDEPHPELAGKMAVIHRQAQILGIMLTHELRFAEQVRQTERVEQAAHQDVLTGVGNRRAWDVAMAREEARAAAFATAVTIVVLDLNGLKQVNDEQGHEAGDELIARTAEELAGRLRSSDVVARLGGDEFGLLLPHTTREQGLRLTDEILERLAAVGVSASAGVAQRTAAGGLIETWRQADAFMYEDKKGNSTRRTLQAPPTTRPKPTVFPLHHSAHTVDAVLELVKAQLGMEVAFVNRFLGDQREFRNLVSSIELPISAGTVEPAVGSYCRLIADGELPSVIPDTRANPVVNRLPVTKRLGIGSYVGIPLDHHDGRPYGTLCAFSTSASPDLGERDAQVLRNVSELVMRLVEAEDDRDDHRHAFLRAVDEVEAKGGPTAVYQPIHRLRDLAVVGYEALSRFPGDSRSPAEWFAQATVHGAGPQLEVSAVRAAVTALPRIEGYLSLNISPTTVLTPEFARVISELPLDRVVLELTEHEVIEDYDSVNASLRSLRERGLRVAVDDAGAGFASMRHILAIMPDVIKLDVSLVRGIDHEFAKQALAASLVAFGAKTSATLVAEGIETAAELNCLRELDVACGQGFHLSRPEPLPVQRP